MSQSNKTIYDPFQNCSPVRSRNQTMSRNASKLFVERNPNYLLRLKMYKFQSVKRITDLTLCKIRWKSLMKKMMDEQKNKYLR